MSQTRSPSAGSLFNHPFSFSKKPSAESKSTTPGFPISQLHIRVTGGEHSGETRGFLFAPPTFTRLFKMSMISHDLERAFAVDLFFQTPQGLINRFAFFKLNFGQNFIQFLSKGPRAAQPPLLAPLFGQCLLRYFVAAKCQPPNDQGQVNKLTRQPMNSRGAAELA